MAVLLPNPLLFDWDKGNRGKNLKGHKVSDEECEEAFFDPIKRINEDKPHSKKEERYIFIGQTKSERKLFIVFTVRNEKIRVISARDLSRKERKEYEEKT